MVKGCDGAPSLVITADILTRYPQLSEKGLKAGDEITIGSAPMDGIVRGPMQKGKCAESCTFSYPEIDGNKPLTWESEFVREFFPYEIISLKAANDISEIPNCYDEALRLMATKHIVRMDISMEDLVLAEKYADGNCSGADLIKMSELLDKAVEKARKSGEPPIGLLFAQKMLRMEIESTKRQSSEGAKK